MMTTRRKMSELWSLSSSVFLVAVLARVSGELLRCHRCGRRRHGYLWLSFWLKTSWWSFPWASSWWSFPWAPSWWLWWWSLVSFLSSFFRFECAVLVLLVLDVIAVAVLVVFTDIAVFLLFMVMVIPSPPR